MQLLYKYVPKNLAFISLLLSSSEMQLLSEKIDTYTCDPHDHAAGLCVKLDFLLVENIVCTWMTIETITWDKRECHEKEFVSSFRREEDRHEWVAQHSATLHCQTANFANCAPNMILLPKNVHLYFTGGTECALRW